MIRLDQAALLLTRLPYPQHVSRVSITEREMRFQWRGTAFQVFLDTDMLITHTVDDSGFLAGSDTAILMQQILTLAYKEILMEDINGSNKEGEHD
jgi:hypothetical protein